MLEYLKLENVGPAPCMEVEFARRVNLITGDNGLGKSFLLDAAWWVLTGVWPAELNRRMNSGFPARPRERGRDASIAARVRFGDQVAALNQSYSRAGETWGGRDMSSQAPGLVVYVQADGSFSVWDFIRNDVFFLGKDYFKRRSAYVFTETEVWDGLREVVNGRSVPFCNGLLHDWSAWIKAGDSNAKAMAEALRALSPESKHADGIRPGPPVRLSIEDVRDVPTIRTPYAGEVPVIHASAGIRRVVALAYIITWVRLFCVGGPEGSRRGCERHGKSYLTLRRRGEAGDGGGSLTGGAIPSA